MLHKIWNFVLRLIGKRFPPKKHRHFPTVAHLDSIAGARRAGVGELLLIGPEAKPKWLRFLCPCGCGEEQALNLMKSHYPHWSVELHEDSTISVRPSVDAKTCGAHFWIRHNDVDWC